MGAELSDRTHPATEAEVSASESMEDLGRTRRILGDPPAPRRSYLGDRPPGDEMTRRRKARPGIARVEIDGVPDYRDRRIGNAERFVVAMRQDRSATITVDADTPEMAEALALDFWKSRRLGGRPRPFIVRRDPLPEPSEEAWALLEVQDEVDRAGIIGAEAQEARDLLIRKTKSVRPVEAAAITGLTKGRISQILRES